MHHRHHAFAKFLIWDAEHRAVGNTGQLVQFGLDFGAELVKTPEGKKNLQQAVNVVFPTMLAFFGRSLAAGWLFVPYLAWVSFAIVLNASIWWLN